MNTRHFYLLLLLVLFFSARLAGQGWERIYPNLSQPNGGTVNKVLPAPGGGFFLLVSDQDGPTNQYDFHVSRIDANGKVEWVRHYDFGGNEFAQDMIATSDGGYAIVYQSFSPIDSTKTHLLRLDVQWNVVSNEELAEPALVSSLSGRQLLENQQKIYIFGTSFGGPPGTFLTRGFCQVYDLAGNAQEFVQFGADNTDFKSAVTAASGEFITTLSGYTLPAGKSVAYAIRLALPSGTPEWILELKDNDVNNYVEAIVAAPDGGYVLSGARNADGLLVKLDDSGNIIWEKNFPYVVGALNFFGISRIAPAADGTGYWVTSVTDSYIPQIVLLRLDLQGNKLLQKTFGAWFTYNSANSLLALPDGLIGGGYNQSAQAQGQPTPSRAFVFRTDEDGNTFLNGVTGSVLFDDDGDCAGDSDSTFFSTPVYALQNGQVVAQGAVDFNGTYYLPLDTGAYQITTHRPNPAWVICAPDTLTVTVASGDTATADFVIRYDPQPVDSVRMHAEGDDGTDDSGGFLLTGGATTAIGCDNVEVAQPASGAACCRWCSPPATRSVRRSCSPPSSSSWCSCRCCSSKGSKAASSVRSASPTSSRCWRRWWCRFWVGPCRAWAPCRTAFPTQARVR